MLSNPTIFKSMWAAKRAALTADADCSRGEAAHMAVLMVGGSIDKCPVQKLLGRAVENLGMRPEITRCRGPLYDGAWAWLDDLDDDGVRSVFAEMDRIWNLGFRGRGQRPEAA